MKIRTDFVTNSSSSSFVTITITTKKGKVYNIVENDERAMDIDSLPVISGKKVKYYCDDGEIQIKKVSDLIAAIYFNSVEEVDFNVSKAIFEFLAGKISGKKLLSLLSDEEGFEELLEIEPDDYDDDDYLNEEILFALEPILEDMSYPELLSNDCVAVLAAKEINHLAEIDHIYIENLDSSWEEFTTSDDVEIEENKIDLDFSDFDYDESSFSVFKYDKDVTNICFNNGYFCLTGFDFDDRYVAVLNYILKNRGIIKDHISKKTKYLIACESYEEKTTKYNDAIKLKKEGNGIRIISVKQFFELTKAENVKNIKIEVSDREIMNQTKLVELPAGMKIIPYRFFFENTIIESINMPDEVIAISEEAFKGCENLKDIRLSMGLLEIGDRAFVDCKEMVDIVIPETVFHISASAFKGCSSLENVFISAKNIIFERTVFADCPKVKIHAPKGSTAEEYAKKYMIPFIAE